MTTQTAEPTLLDLLATPSAGKPSTWLVNHLIAAGHLTETGLSRRARIRTCKCHQLILAGLDNDTCALEATVDPIPLTPLGEALALVEARHTWTLRREGDKWVLDWRYAADITHWPAASRPRRDVLRQHRCDTTPPDGPLAAGTNFAETRPQLPPHSPPPF